MLASRIAEPKLEDKWVLLGPSNNGTLQCVTLVTSDGGLNELQAFADCDLAGNQPGQLWYYIESTGEWVNEAADQLCLTCMLHMPNGLSSGHNVVIGSILPMPCIGGTKVR
jgi:hypothetical protein